MCACRSELIKGWRGEIEAGSSLGEDDDSESLPSLHADYEDYHQDHDESHQRYENIDEQHEVNLRAIFLAISQCSIAAT